MNYYDNNDDDLEEGTLSKTDEKQLNTLPVLTTDEKELKTVPFIHTKLYSSIKSSPIPAPLPKTILLPSPIPAPLPKTILPPSPIPAPIPKTILPPAPIPASSDEQTLFTFMIVVLVIFMIVWVCTFIFYALPSHYKNTHYSLGRCFVRSTLKQITTCYNKICNKYKYQLITPCFDQGFTNNITYEKLCDQQDLYCNFKYGNTSNFPETCFYSLDCLGSVSIGKPDYIETRLGYVIVMTYGLLLLCISCFCNCRRYNRSAHCNSKNTLTSIISVLLMVGFIINFYLLYH